MNATAMYKMGLNDGIACMTKEGNDVDYAKSHIMLCKHMGDKAKRQQDRDYWKGMENAARLGANIFES